MARWRYLSVRISVVPVFEVKEILVASRRGVEHGEVFFEQPLEMEANKECHRRARVHIDETAGNLSLAAIGRAHAGHALTSL